MAGLVLLCAATLAIAGPADPATRPASPPNGWSPRLFDYERPPKLVVEESTPTPAQVEWRGWPAQMKADEADPAERGRAQPRAVEQMDVLRLRFKDVDGEAVPVLLCTPRGKKGPFPVVVAVHGLTSNKMQVCAGLRRRFASAGSRSWRPTCRGTGSARASR